MKKKIYQVAMYLRLSRDDIPTGGGDMNGNVKFESNSISSQREIIRSFIREQDDMELYDIYVDDGFTGSNFNRPDFKRMMDDIDAGMINCVIVKDLSRFGRDYIEAGRYIQKSFPQKGIRFIAVIDHFDSLTAEASESSIILPVKNFINDSYCRDASIRVKSGLEVKRKKGEFIGSFAVYGYRKDTANKNKLVVDDYAASVVKSIFRWKIEGLSNAAIAVQLNELGCLSPMDYKKSLGENFKTGFTGSSSTKWQTVAVKRILTNEVYLGHMIQGKKGKINYKVDKLIEKPEEEWIKVENTHEPIITEDDFQIVRNLLQVDVRASSCGKSGNFFSGLLFCAHCKEQMVRRVIRYPMKGCEQAEKFFYICSTYNRGEGCKRHSISEENLRDIVQKECKLYANSFMEQASLLNEIDKKEANFEVITQYDKEMTRLRKEQEKYYKLCSGLYKDLQNGVISKQDFDKLHYTYTRRSDDLENALRKQEELIKKLFRQGILSGNRLDKFRSCLELTEIDRHTLASLVQHIYIYAETRLEIVFRFRNEFEAAECLNEANTVEDYDAGERGMKYA